MERVVNIFFGGHRLVGAWWGAALPMEGGGGLSLHPPPLGYTMLPSRGKAGRTKPG